MAKFIILVLVLGAGFFFATTVARTGEKFEASQFNLTAPVGFSEKPCFGKAKCLVAYFAPWCGYCRASTPAVKALMERYRTSASTGVMVVIGGDKPENMDAYASAIGPGAFTDPERSFAEQLKIRSFPSWIVFDSAMKVTKRWSGGIKNPEDIARAAGF